MKPFIAGTLLSLGVLLLILRIAPFDEDSNALILAGALLCGSPIYGYLYNYDMIFAPGATIKRGRKNEFARIVGFLLSVFVFSIFLAKALKLW